MPTEVTSNSVVEYRAKYRAKLATQVCLTLVLSRKIQADMVGEWRDRIESRIERTRSDLLDLLGRVDLAAVRSGLFAATEDPESSFTLQDFAELREYFPELFADQQ